MVINLTQENSTLPPVVLNTASNYFKQGVVNRPFGADYHQILFVLEGKGTLTYKNKIFTLDKGCSFYTAPNIPISYQGTDNMIVAFLTVRGDALSQLAKFYRCKGFLFFSDVDIRKYLLDINAIIDEYQSYKREGIISLLSYSVYVNFFEHQQKKLNIFDEIAIYIDKNFTKKITLNDIALTFGISVSKLCCDFKKRFNCTVFEYILKLRLNYARNIFLTNNDARTKDVALSCGFEDISYFCKAYKQKFKVSPSVDKYNINNLSE